MVDLILNWAFEYKRDIIIAVIVLLLTTLYNRLSSVLKKITKALNDLGDKPTTGKQILKVILFHILPLLFIISFIFVLRDKVVTFGIIGLFIIVCAMYLIVIFLTIIGNMLKISSENLKIQKDVLSAIEMSNKEINSEIEALAKISIENKKD